MVKIVLEKTGKLGKHQKAILLRAANFYAKNLIKTSKSLSVRVVIIHGRQDERKDEYCARYGPYDYKIRLCYYKNHFGRLLHSLAHEMVHVKQFFKKELGIIENKWKGQKVLHSEYYRFPWEIEAEGLGWGLYALLLNECPDIKNRCRDHF